MRRPCKRLLRFILNDVIHNLGFDIGLYNDQWQNQKDDNNLIIIHKAMH